MTTLLESNFMLADLGALFSDAQNVDVPTKGPKTAPVITDWGTEFKKRIADNKQLNPEARQPEYKIEDAFWEEYFKANWKDIAVADQLIKIGDALRDAIKILGFDAIKNPILAFIKQEYVQTELIKTKLLTTHTYRAIHQAVAKKLVAQSEFEKVSDYNVIYCKDLYTKFDTDMLKYLEIQKKILNPDSNFYSTEEQTENKQMLLQPGFTSMIEAGAKLKDLRNTADKNKKLPADEQSLQKFADGLRTKAEIQAALQFISMTASGDIANKALETIVYSGDTKPLLFATKKISKELSRMTLTNQGATLLLNLLMRQAERLH